MPVCSKCQEEVPREGYSRAQLKKKANLRACRMCTGGDITESSHQDDKVTPCAAEAEAVVARTALQNPGEQVQEQPQKKWTSPSAACAIDQESLVVSESSESKPSTTPTADTSSSPQSSMESGTQKEEATTIDRLQKELTALRVQLQASEERASNAVRVMELTQQRMESMENMVQQAMTTLTGVQAKYELLQQERDQLRLKLKDGCDDNDDDDHHIGANEMETTAAAAAAAPAPPAPSAPAAAPPEEEWTAVRKKNGRR